MYLVPFEDWLEIIAYKSTRCYLNAGSSLYRMITRVSYAIFITADDYTVQSRPIVRY